MSTSTSSFDPWGINVRLISLNIAIEISGCCQIDMNEGLNYGMILQRIADQVKISDAAIGQ